MEWFILRDTDGSISTVERNHFSNAVTKNKTFVANRGDILQIELSKEFLQNTSVKKNDLIATIYLNETSRQLVEFRGKLNSAIAELKSVSTGEKKELIAEAKQRLNKAEEEYIQEQKEFERISGLYNGQLISLEQYELAQSRLRIKQIDRDLQTASLSGLTSGAKPEQVDAIRTEIQLIENEINVLEEKEIQFLLTAPFNAQVFKTGSSDTLVFIADNQRIVFIPIAFKYYDKVKQEQTIVLDIGGKKCSGKIFHISPKVEYMNNEMIFFSWAKLDGVNQSVPLYSVFKGSIECDGVTPWEYIKDFLEIVTKWEE